MPNQKFIQYKNVIEEGDTVIIQAGANQMYSLVIERGKVFQTKRGAFKHEDAIDKPYGSQIKCSIGWIYILFPTPELWTLTLPHRTQILYQTDISMIIMQLDVKPGTVVLEAGTGSGSMSHCLIRSIAPTGHLYTFDFHEQRSILAKEEFINHGLADLVTATHKDVCSEGFDIQEKADAIFLDLPSPWDALPFAKKAFKNEGGRICTFSPCIEQVQKTCLELDRLGFTEIRTMECLLREYLVQTVRLKTMDSNEDNSFNDEPPVGRVIENLSQQNKTNEMKDSNVDTDETNECDQTEGKKHMPSNKEANKFYQFKTAVPKGFSQGHTGFLTFASIYKLLTVKSENLEHNVSSTL